jgi:hypothetical protein
MTDILTHRLTHILDKYGQEVTYYKVSAGSYSPGTGLTGGDEDTYTVRGYFSSFDLEETDSTLLGSRKLTIPTVDINGSTIPEPDGEDYFVGVGDRVEVISVSKIYKGDSLICYKLRVKE